MGDKKKCSHPTCGCPALPLMDYCCEECRDAANREVSGEEPMDECKCGHEDCGVEIEIPAETQGILIASEALAT